MLFNPEYILANYQEYLEPLHKVRRFQANSSFVRPEGPEPQLDDIEAEITYLSLRAHKPKTVVEIGSFNGWSTTWILHALRDNGFGELITHDLVDNARFHVPEELSEGRWTFNGGDVRKQLSVPLEEIDYLFLDAAHSWSFARWYIEHVLPGLRAGTPVSVHDVFHHRYAVPFSEGHALVRWLRQGDVPFFTPSRARNRDDYERILQFKKSRDLDQPVHSSRANPMVFFHAP